ncbi:MAG TPA: acetate--CoA ligase family protein, partial [Xanthobacteraceae bacterium]|nr:acetate--CoA ligase family protein [Xanthobacteraceae bacterium]
MRAAEHGPDRSALHGLLTPASIAILGASPDLTKIRGLLLQVLRKNGYAGRIYPVNPNHAQIDGLDCYPCIGAIGEPVDLALLAIPAAQIPPALEACAHAGVRYAVIIASGFAEEGGPQNELQQRVTEIARRTGIRICGPNTEGFHNEIANVSATFSPAIDHGRDVEPIIATRRRVGIVAQSGGVGFSLYHRGRAQGLSFSYVVSTGNEADLTLADFLDYMIGDQQTDAVLMFLETVRDPQTFLVAAARALEGSKPIIAVKVGRTSSGSRAALSHTASMTGWDGAYEAVFKTFGIIVASDPDEAIAIAAALTSAPLPAGARTCVVTVSGGAGAWAADTLASRGLALPELSSGLQQTIRGLIPSYGSARNPIDITAQAVHTGAFLQTIELLSRCEEVDIIVVVNSMARETRVPFDTAALGQVIKISRKPILFYSYTLPSQIARKAMAKAGAVIFIGLAAVGRAVHELVLRAHVTPPAPVRVAALSAKLRKRLRGAAGTLTEHQSKGILAQYGVRVAPGILVRDAEELDEAARAIGYPLVLKAQSPDLPHKTEIGGVRLNIADPAALRAAYDEIISALAVRAPRAKLDGVRLEPMAPAGIEIIVGVIRDALFGPVLMVGAGGVATELFKDVAYRLAPVDRGG